ncbi:hypothetical protein [cf. Phormidesmis sp. LEGE 11477]|nr:hypothetical protein [cf. Phormidesmis sp. LEGE 11477]MBE9062750.1 hypothetical protein [cf. Phormidesmis sp. LEGE 11477]
MTSSFGIGRYKKVSKVDPDRQQIDIEHADSAKQRRCGQMAYEQTLYV